MVSAESLPETGKREKPTIDISIIFRYPAQGAGNACSVIFYLFTIAGFCAFSTDLLAVHQQEWFGRKPFAFVSSFAICSL
jgi:hypothetical protein